MGRKEKRMGNTTMILIILLFSVASSTFIPACKSEYEV